MEWLLLNGRPDDPREYVVWANETFDIKSGTYENVKFPKYGHYS